MGQEQSKGQSQGTYEDLMKKYDKVEVIENDVQVLKEKNGDKIIGLREFNLTDESDFNKVLQKFKPKLNLDHTNLVKVHNIFEKKEAQFCSTFYKVHVAFELIQNNLQLEIMNRVDLGQYFTEEELWNILTQCILGVCYLYSNGQQHTNVRPSTVLITADGIVKVVDPVLLSQQPLYFDVLSNQANVQSGVYLAPELLNSVYEQEPSPSYDLQKSDVFSLGMTVLHAANLLPLDDIYDYKNCHIDEATLQDRLNQVQQSYGSNLFNFLRAMLEFNVNQRQDIFVFDQILNQHQGSGNLIQESPAKIQERSPGQDYQAQQQQQEHDTQEMLLQQLRQEQERLQEQQEQQLKQLQLKQQQEIYELQQKELQIQQQLKKQQPAAAPGVQKHQSTGSVSRQQIQPTQSFQFEEESVKKSSNGDVVKQKTYVSNIPISAQPSQSTSIPTTSAQIQIQQDGFASRGVTDTPSASNIEPLQVKNSLPAFVQHSNPQSYQYPNPQVSSQTATFNETITQQYKLTSTPALSSVASQQQQPPQQQQPVTESYTTPYSSSLPLQPQNTYTSTPYTQLSQQNNTYTPLPPYSSVTQTNTTYKPVSDPISKPVTIPSYTPPPVNTTNVSYTATNAYKLPETNFSYTPGPSAYTSGYTSTANLKNDDTSNIEDAIKRSAPPPLKNNDIVKITSVETRVAPSTTTTPATISAPINYETYKQSEEIEAILSKYRIKQEQFQQQNQPENNSALQSYQPISSGATGNNTYLNTTAIQGYSLPQTTISAPPATTSLNPAPITTTNPASYNFYQSSYTTDRPVQQLEQLSSQFGNLSLNGTNANPSTNVHHSFSSSPFQPQLQQANTNTFTSTTTQVKDYAPQTYQASSLSQPNYGQSQQFGIYDYNQQVGQSSDSKSPYDLAQYSISSHQREFVIENYSNNSKYEGEKLNGMRDGKGKFFYPDGGLFEGDWKENKMHGKGVLRYASGKPAFDGDWVEDKFEGFGVLYNESPAHLNSEFDYTDFDNVDEYWTRYEGQFKDDNKEGYGTLYLSNGEKFVGSFFRDFVSGEGVFYTINGQAIQGNWDQNKLI